MTIKGFLLTLLGGILVGAFLMFKFNKQEPKVIRDTQTVENVKYVDRIIKGKDGETIIEHVTETQKEVIEKVKPLLPKYRVGIIGGYDFQRREDGYGLVINKPINQDIEVGLYAKPKQQEIGLMVTIGF